MSVARVRRSAVRALGVALAFAAADAPAARAEPARLEASVARRVRATLRTEVRVPRLRTREWIVYMPRPPDLPGQRVLAVEVAPRADPYAAAEPWRTLLRARVHPDEASTSPHGLTTRLVVDAELHARRLVTTPPGDAAQAPPALEAEESTRFTRATPLLDFESAAFEAWLDADGLRRRQGEDDLAFARRVFTSVRRRLGYVYSPGVPRRATSVVANERSDCGGIGGVYVAALRAAGVPARLLYGRWATSARDGEELGGEPYRQTHVKTEAFVRGVGWVPADPSSAILHDPDLASERFFGRDDGDFVVLHVDPEISLDSVYWGSRTLDGLQTPAWFARGAGTTDGAVTRDEWSVEPLP